MCNYSGRCTYCRASHKRPVCPSVVPSNTALQQRNVGSQDPPTPHSFTHGTVVPVFGTPPPSYYNPAPFNPYNYYTSPLVPSYYGTRAIEAPNPQSSGVMSSCPQPPISSGSQPGSLPVSPTLLLCQMFLLQCLPFHVLLGVNLFPLCLNPKTP